MTLAEIKAQIMFQTNNDAEDLGEYEPHLGDYINQGYDMLVEAYRSKHVSNESEEYPPLKEKTDEPNLPQYVHRSLADFGTYMVYRNGNAIKQNRGMPFYSAFMEAVAAMKFDAYTKPHKFINIY